MATKMANLNFDVHFPLWLANASLLIIQLHGSCLLPLKAYKTINQN